MASTHKLIDYFVISGLDVESGLEPDQLSGDSLHCSPLDRPYKSHILAHFPDSVAGNPFDAEAVCLLCYPHGLHFHTQIDSNETKFHTFMVTKEDGSRVYGATIQFFEQVDNELICGAMQTLQDMHQAELSNSQSRTLNPPSLSPVHSDSSLATQSPQCNTSPSHSRQSSSSVCASVAQRHLSPRHQSPARCSLDAFKGRTYHKSKDVLFVTKSICIISRLPFVDTFHRYLMSLYEMVFSNTGGHELPVISFVYNILHEVPMPQPGHSIRITIPNGESIICQRPGITELPLLDYPLLQIFEMFDVDQVLTLYTSILLEHQILIYSCDFQKLMLVTEGLTSLIFPFQWQHVYVPILPASLHHFLDAPVPYIMGMQTTTDVETFSKANMCIVNIDAGIVDKPEELPVFPYFEQLKQDIEQELRRVRTVRGDDKFTSHQRDSGCVRDSFVGSEYGQAGMDNSLTWSLSARMAMLEQNDTLARLTAIAKKTGVVSSLDDIRDGISDAAMAVHKSAMTSTTGLGGAGLSGALLSSHAQDLIFNNTMREIFLHYLLHIFGGYEAFVVIPKARDMESWLNTRETTQNFDKTAFLSDHSAGHLLFLSPFTETQMFTSFVDSKIISHWSEEEGGGGGPIEKNLMVWEQRLKAFRDDQGEQRLRRFYRTAAAKESESMIERRDTVLDEVAPAPHHLLNDPIENDKDHRFFPNLSSAILNREPPSNRKSKWRQMYGIPLRSEQTFEQREKYIELTRSKVPRQPNLADLNPKAMVNTNWKFMEALLKECKTKTKRMLVQKMGQEAVDLGHGEVTVVGVEENMLIAGLCDLLDRIWSHGLQQKQCSSALWFHLMSFQSADQMNKKNQASHSLHPEGQSEDDADSMNGTRTWPMRHHRRKPSRGPELPVLDALPVSLLRDLRTVCQMSEIKTDVGYSRAFVRLSLEKKVLSKHLKELLSNVDLIRDVYRRYAFLRCEDEREQFLYHLLSLNAVDYFCFTNSFTTTTITYRILVFPRMKLSGGTTTANCWVSLAGQLGETNMIHLPKHILDVTVQNKNLGILTTMRVGHDNAGISPKWMVEHVLVRNEVTDHTYRFPCGRWLGKGTDDGALERLLVAEPVPPTVDANELLERCRTPPRCRSPSIPRRSTEPRLMASDIQHQLSDAVNSLVKHLCRLEKERSCTTGSVTGLLCGEYGLVFCMEHVFQYGFKSSRLFRGRFYIWDFLERVLLCLEPATLDREHYEIEKNMRDIMESFCHVVTCINLASESIGKDERFQIFICIGVRDRMLQKWLKMIRRTPVTATMYEEHSFLRELSLAESVIQILDSLTDFNISLESSLIKGVKL